MSISQCVFAVSEAGLVWVPLNFRLTAPEAAFIVNDAGCAALIYSSDLISTVEPLVGLAPDVRALIAIGESRAPGHRYEDLLSRGSDSRATARPSESDLVAIMYASGTTGNPKGVMLTHRQHVSGMAYTASLLALLPTTCLCR